MKTAVAMEKQKPGEDRITGLESDMKHVFSDMER
jgi:hypothetical protein